MLDGAITHGVVAEANVDLPRLQSVDLITGVQFHELQFGVGQVSTNAFDDLRHPSVEQRDFEADPKGAPAARSHIPYIRLEPFYPCDDLGRLLPDEFPH